MSPVPRHLPTPTLRRVPAQPHAEQPSIQLALQFKSSRLQKILCGFKVAGLEPFFNQILADTEVVQAYFEPRSLNVGARNPAGQLTVPVNESVLAASRARRLEIVLPHERGLAAVAAFLHAGGLYFITSSMAGEICPQANIAHFAREHRWAWLEEPLRALRSSNPALGATLTAGMEMGNFGGCDAEQVARLITARRLANLSVEALWLPSPA